MIMVTELAEWSSGLEVLVFDYGTRWMVAVSRCGPSWVHNTSKSANVNNALEPVCHGDMLAGVQAVGRVEQAVCQIE